MVTRSTSPNMVKSDLVWAHHRPYSHLCGECSGKDRSPDILMVKTKRSSFYFVIRHSSVCSLNPIFSASPSPTGLIKQVVMEYTFNSMNCVCVQKGVWTK